MPAHWLYAATRNPAFLWKSALLILAHSFLFAFLIQLVGGAWAPAHQRFQLAHLEQAPDATRIGAKVIASGTLPEALDVIMTLSQSRSRSSGPVEVNTAFVEGCIKQRPSDEQKILRAAAQSSLSSNGIVDTPLAELAENEPDLPGAAFAAGILATHFVDLDEAEKWFAREQSPQYGSLARQSELEVVANRGHTERLQELLQNPEYYRLAPIGVRMDLDYDQGRWVALFISSLQSTWYERSWQAWFITLLAAAVWTAIVLRLANVGTWRDNRLISAAAAFLLGVLSAVFTLMALIWQERAFGIVEDGTFINGVIYYIAGVAAREECLKLLCVAPLLWFLRGDPDDRRVLMVGAMSGLGFAAAENLNYVDANTVGTAFSRFMTANFLHLALTALAAQGLVTWLRHPTRGFDHFLFRLTAVILLHGVYNLFLTQTALAEYTILSLTTLGGIGLWYFHQVRLERRNQHMTISLHALFVWGMVGLIGIGYVLGSWDFGLYLAFQIMLQSFLGSGLLMFIFFREFDQVG